MSHTTVSKTGKPIFPTCLLQHNLVHFKLNSEINTQKTFHCNGLWCIVYNITLNAFLHDLLFSTPSMTFLHCNLRGSPSRQPPPYLQVNVDILLCRPNTSTTPFLLVLTLKSVEKSYMRCFLSRLATEVLRFHIMDSSIYSVFSSGFVQ